MNDEDSDTSHKGLIILIISLITLTVLLSSISHADNGKTNKTIQVDKIKKAEPLIEQVENRNQYSPYSVKMNSTDIYVKGCLPRKAGYGYKRYDVHLKNYFNGNWGYLKYEQAPLEGYIPGFSAVEGMLYYSKRDKMYDCDFDFVSGRSGDYQGKYQLTVVSCKMTKYYNIMVNV